MGILSFEIYRSYEDNKYYWRLVENITNWANLQTTKNIIATGNQSYDSENAANVDVKKVKTVTPSTPVRYIGYEYTKR